MCTLVKVEKSEKPGPKFCPKIMVWGALSYRDFYLKIWDHGTMNSSTLKLYKNLFCTPMDFIQITDKWVRQSDGATPPPPPYLKRNAIFFQEKTFKCSNGQRIYLQLKMHGGFLKTMWRTKIQKYWGSEEIYLGSGTRNYVTAAEIADRFDTWTIPALHWCMWRNDWMTSSNINNNSWS